MMEDSRKQAGEFELPQPIIEFVINSLDDILKEYFKIESGFPSSNIDLVDLHLQPNSFFSAIVERYKNLERTGIEFKDFNLFAFSPSHKLIEQESSNYKNSKLFPYSPIEAINHKYIDATPEKLLVLLGYPPHFVIKGQSQRQGIFNTSGNQQHALRDSFIAYIRYVQEKLKDKNNGIAVILCNQSIVNSNALTEVRKSLYQNFDLIYSFDIQESSRLSKEVNIGQQFFSSKIGLTLLFLIKVDYKLPKFIMSSKQLNDYPLLLEKGDFLKRKSLSSINWEVVPLNSTFSFQDERLLKEHEIKKTVKKYFPICLKQIKIKNYKGIESLHIKEIPDGIQWIFLTGDNAIGKSSILESIVIGFCDEDGNQIKKSSRQIGYKSQISLQYFSIGESFVNDTIDLTTFNRLTEFAAYGAIRHNLAEKKKEISIENAFFEEQTILYNIEEKLIELSVLEELHPFKNMIEKTLLELLPNLSSIKIIPNESKTRAIVVYREENSTTDISFSDLSMGMKSIIGLIGDLLIRLTLNIPIKDTRDIEGIVLIDEFDNHLHPKWQRRLVEKLTELFPKVQFIVSTHSPIPLLGAPVDRTVILNVNRTKEEGITVERVDDKLELEELLPNTILTSPIFGFNDIVHKQAIRPESKVRTEDTFSELEKNNELNKKIKDFLTEAKEQELIERIKAKRNK